MNNHSPSRRFLQLCVTGFLLTEGNLRTEAFQCIPLLISRPPPCQRHSTSPPSISISVASTATTVVTSASDEPPSLYKEQERLLVERGIIEEGLMNTHTAIEPSVTKGTGTAKGFGGGAKSSSSSRVSSSDLKAAAKAHARELRKQGVVRIDSVLSDDMADALRDYVMELREESEELVRTGQVQSLQRFADVLLRKNRCDLTLPLEDDIVVDAVLSVLQQSPVGIVVSSILGKDAALYELSCLISDPGSQRQVVHPDTPYGTDDEPVLYTCFMALQDIDADMGPTIFLPGTHTDAAHQQFQDETIPKSSGGNESPKDRLLRTTPALSGIVPKGSCTIFDSRLLHCGSANKSQQRRALFYFSFKNSKVQGYPGNPGSIRRELLSKFTYSTLEKELKQLQNNGNGGRKK